MRQGKKPLSKFTSADRDVVAQALHAAGCTVSLTVQELKLLLSRYGRSSWHHTSKHFNRTDFYALAALCERLDPQEGLDNLTSEEALMLCEKLAAVRVSRQEMG